MGCIELCLVAPAGSGSWAFVFPAPVTGMRTHAVVTVHGDPMSNRAMWAILLCVPMMVVMLVCVTAGDVESGCKIVPGFKHLHEKSRLHPVDAG